MVAFNTVVALDAIVALVQGLTGMQGTVYVGVPESFSTTLAAYVALGDFSVVDKGTGGYMSNEQEFLVVFGYRVQGNESRAERKVAEYKDLFIRAWVADRTLGETVDSSALVPGLASTPQYEPFASTEVRLYPIVIRTSQRAPLT
jgi:hypothetical protein